MFFAIVPPPQIREDIGEFLAPREGLPWIHPDQFHLTLAFMKSVPEHRLDDLIERFSEAAHRRRGWTCQIAGAGTFGDPSRAKVLWLGVRPHPFTGVGYDTDSDLYRLSVNARAAANRAGANPDGRQFHPHITLAHLKRPLAATKWLRVLDTYASEPWQVTEVHLISSYLREGPAGRPRHEIAHTFDLGR